MYPKTVRKRPMTAAPEHSQQRGAATEPRLDHSRNNDSSGIARPHSQRQVRASPLDAPAPGKM